MKQELVNQLQTAVVMLAMIPTQELEQHIKDCERSISLADSFGPIIDPTGWQRAQASGSMEDARHQLTITEHLLKARRAIDVREAFVSEKVGIDGGE